MRYISQKNKKYAILIIDQIFYNSQLTIPFITNFRRMTNNSTTELKICKDYINSVDLSNVIARLVNVEKWTEKQAREACEQYKIFIYLCKKHRPCVLPPSIDIDEVWHAHILHTKEYANFCDNVFGQFLHHDPGLHSGSGNSLNYAEAFDQYTQKFFFEETGDYIYAIRPIPTRIRISKFLNRFMK